MKHTAEKRARKHWGFAGAQEETNNFHTVHIARYDFLCVGKNSERAKKCAHARGQVARCSAHGRRVDSLHCVAQAGGEVCCCTRIGRMQQLFFMCASHIKNFRSAQARCGRALTWKRCARMCVFLSRALGRATGLVPGATFA